MCYSDYDSVTGEIHDDLCDWCDALTEILTRYFDAKESQAKTHG
jgi:hypothetical protein